MTTTDTTPSHTVLPYTVGLGPLLEAAAKALGGTPPGPVRRAVADRYTITVTDAGISTRGLLRSHRADWDRMEAIVLEPVATLAARRVVGTALRRIAGRAVPWPGLRSLVQRGVTAALVDPISKAAGALVTDRAPEAFVGARTRKGEGVTLDGALALVSVLAGDLTDTVVAEAVRHGVPVESQD